MNDSFFDLPEEKRRNIMNAAYKVFAGSSYRHASMSEIAAECGISKSLLFYYFKNKLELYCFLWDRALSLSAETVREFGVYDTRDFFEMLRRSLRAKCSLMRRYDHLAWFTMNAYYEKDPGAGAVIAESFSGAEDTAFRQLEERIDTSVFREGMDFKEIYGEIMLASEGMLIRLYRSGSVSADLFEEQYEKMIAHWEKTYGRKEE